MPKLEKKSLPVERKVFAKNLKEARLFAGYTLQTLSDKTGITVTYISGVERLTYNISLDSMTKLSHAVQVPLYALLNPNFNKFWDLNNVQEWLSYKNLIDQIKPASLERQLVAENVKRLRKEAGYTQQEVDELSGYATTSELERQLCNITLDKILPLAHLFGVPLYTIFQLPPPVKNTTP